MYNITNLLKKELFQGIMENTAVCNVGFPSQFGELF